MDKKLNQIKEELIEKYKNIYDPEIPVNLYDLGLIYDIDLSIENDEIFCKVNMTLTSPGCSVAESLVAEVRQATSNTIENSKVYLTFNPPWTKEKMSEDAKEILAASGAAMFL